MPEPRPTRQPFRAGELALAENQLGIQIAKGSVANRQAAVLRDPVESLLIMLGAARQSFRSVEQGSKVQVRGHLVDCRWNIRFFRIGIRK